MLSTTNFERLWEEALLDGCENLVTKILVRGDLRVSDLLQTFQAIANLGVRVH